MSGLHKTKTCPIVVSVETHARLKQLAKERGTTIGKVIAELLGVGR